jgi:hypothetical protein
MFEACLGFDDFVREYGVARSEGLLLRYLSQVHNVLVKSVPEWARNESVIDLIAFLRTLLAGVDSSLVETWEGLLDPRDRPAREASPTAPPVFDLALQERLLVARVRSELHALVRTLAAGDYEGATTGVRQDPDDPWDAHRFERELAAFFEQYERIVFTPDARRNDRTRLLRTSPRTWDATQVLADPQGDDLWALHTEIDLTHEKNPVGPLIVLRRIGT